MKLPTKANKFIKNITVEPAAFFYHLAVVILRITDTNLYLQKACRYNTTTEPDLDTPCDDEKAGILFVSTINVNYRFFETAIILIMAALLISWSDEAGKKRKIFIILPILGLIAQSINGCLHSFFWYWPPLLSALTDISIQALSAGSYIGLVASAQTHICDISNKEDRTMRIGILMAVILITTPIGNGMAALLIRGVGFFNTFSLCLLLAVMSLVSAVLLVKDNSVSTEKKVSVCSIFKCTRIIDSFKVIFKKSLGRKRIVVLLLIIAQVAYFFSIQGEKTVFYLFLRYKFKWDERMFSMYICYKSFGVIIGTIFCSIVLSKILKIHDGVIGSFAGFWDVLPPLAYIFASQNWHLYMIPLLDIFHRTGSQIGFSFASKFYESNEFGRLKAVFCIFKLLIPFSHASYNSVFKKTMDFFPSAFFIISVVVNIAVCVLYIATYILTKKIEARELTRTLDKASPTETYSTCNDTAKEIKMDVSTLEKSDNERRYRLEIPTKDT